MTDIADFKNKTGLRLRQEYSNEYAECSGKSYAQIRKLIEKYNKDHGTAIRCRNDKVKDITYISL